MTDSTTDIAKKIILVPCAIIERDGQVLAAQRSSLMSLPLKWEFPGGKVDEGETEIEALHREIMEELSVEIEIKQRLEPTFKDDELRNRVICLIPYVAKLTSQPIILTEHAQYKWIALDNIKSLDWAPADLEVIDTYLSQKVLKLAKPLAIRKRFSTEKV
ncbi:MAG: (deoxy)nucleoside triphosphate pyrophosphohydrolase [Runella slithyformis]|nr:MAG: (deoxy)nucleoside triphosphate pyrophosphohydrolase [Runella slithyformis]TAF94690.1 MAG: (deoxy)nucleoside triphosphate pyrophosphohydrolase [Runella sp.]TAG16209.1 MAG: (deoxy)nucleoside triphosphate pyrophosphohydrolase [Cytophagales bacterium]TAG35473.1 MAG: (deoxy)nucleoside triphosphate pyrophosphohydrolase [Cytophagia bacterium]TAE98626.1 MAG: (deoxy)nucleoside triphosphate pyrophosphohydrolase [Runella slithyformis]